MEEDSCDPSSRGRTFQDRYVNCRWAIFADLFAASFMQHQYFPYYDTCLETLTNIKRLFIYGWYSRCNGCLAVPNMDVASVCELHAPAQFHSAYPACFVPDCSWFLRRVSSQSPGTATLPSSPDRYGNSYLGNQCLAGNQFYVSYVCRAGKSAISVL